MCCLNCTPGQVVLAGGATVARSIHSRTCISGQICSVVGLPGLTTDSEQMQNSSILILDTCALPSHVQGWPQAGQSLTLQLPNSNESARVFPISWGETPVRARGGIYRLCWCPTTPCFTYEDESRMFLQHVLSNERLSGEVWLWE